MNSIAVLVSILYLPTIGLLLMLAECESPQWTVQDTVYFLVMTLTTVGYGDISPATGAGRLIASAYMLFNVCCLSTLALRTISLLLANRRKALHDTHADANGELEAENLFDQLESSIEVDAALETDGILPVVQKELVDPPTVKDRAHHFPHFPHFPHPRAACLSV